MTDPNRTSEVCMWCDQTLAQHRDSGPMAKMPCGGLKRGFRAERAKPITETSVGDVPAPNTKFDMCKACGMNEPSCYSITTSPSACCSNCTHHSATEERAAVVKHLRDEADELSATGSETLDVVAQSLRARAGHIEKGEHLK